MNNVPAHIYLTSEERKLVLQKNDYKAAFEILIHWLWITAAMALAYLYPNPITIILSLFILGGKQLACAILMHDASHRVVFTNTKLNDIIGQYFGAYPIFHNTNNYRDYHLSHHLNTGLEDDPDLLLTRGYPTTKWSMLRKFTRDLTGVTGIKAFVGLMMMKLGYLEYSLGGKVVKVSQKDRTWAAFFKTVYRNFTGPILTNIIIFGLLYFLASPWLYLLWIIAYLTTFQFVLRIRSMAEHSIVEDPENPYKNTRTTYANFIERLLFAPYHVNFHSEHHLLMGVPSYNLPKLHEILKQKGYRRIGKELLECDKISRKATII